jgi:hypothetical protein
MNEKEETIKKIAKSVSRKLDVSGLASDYYKGILNYVTECFEILELGYDKILLDIQNEKIQKDLIIKEVAVRLSKYFDCWCVLKKRDIEALDVAENQQKNEHSTYLGAVENGKGDFFKLFLSYRQGLSEVRDINEGQVVPALPGVEERGTDVVVPGSVRSSIGSGTLGSEVEQKASESELKEEPQPHEKSKLEAYLAHIKGVVAKSKDLKENLEEVKSVVRLRGNSVEDLTRYYSGKAGKNDLGRSKRRPKFRFH